MLAFVEGQLSPEHASRVERAFERDPGLRALASGMRADRARVMALGAAQAPAGLVDRALARAEQSLLLTDHPQARRVQHGQSASVSEFDLLPRAPAVPRRAVPRRWPVRGLAMAAGAAMLVGGTLWVVLRGTSAPSVPASRDPIALNRERDDGATAAMASVGEAATKPTDAGSSDRAPTFADTSSSHAAPAGADASASEAAAAPKIAITDPAERPTLSLERAAELASEGRLGIRVVADPAGTDQATRGVAALAFGESRGRWSLAKTMSPDDLPRIAEQFAAARTEAEIEHRNVARELRTAIAAEHAPAGRGAPVITDDARPEPLAAAFMLETPASPGDLRSAQRALRARTGAAVEFVELPTVTSGPPALTEEAAVWWIQPAVQWSMRAQVPVVVEPAE